MAQTAQPLMPRYSYIGQRAVTVEKVIEALRQMPAKARIRAWDPDAERMVSITGLLMNWKGEVEICTDIP